MFGRCRKCNRVFTKTPDRQDVCSSKCARALLEVEIDEVADLFSELLGIAPAPRPEPRPRWRRPTPHLNPANTRTRGPR